MGHMSKCNSMHDLHLCSARGDSPPVYVCLYTLHASWQRRTTLPCDSEGSVSACALRSSRDDAKATSPRNIIGHGPTRPLFSSLDFIDLLGSLFSSVDSVALAGAFLDTVVLIISVLALGSLIVIPIAPLTHLRWRDFDMVKFPQEG